MATKPNWITNQTQKQIANVKKSKKLINYPFQGIHKKDSSHPSAAAEGREPFADLMAEC